MTNDRETKDDDGKDQATDTPLLTETVRPPEADKDAAEEIAEKGEPPGGSNFA